VSATEMARFRQALRGNNKRTAIGIERSVGTTSLPAASDLAWKSVDGGTAAQLAVSSPQAGAMRLAIDLSAVPVSVEMVFFGSGNPSRLEGPVRVGDIADRTQPWWSPITDGDTQTVEFFVPEAIDAASVKFRVTGVSHLFATLASGLRKEVSDIGRAGACNVDVKCSPLYPTLAFQNMRSSVAQMVLQDGQAIFLCTGQLLNDVPGTHTPWFFSANHCFDNDFPPYKTPAQMQVVANTVQTLWFFEAVTCSNPSDPTVPDYVQLNGGSTYVYSNQPADVLMVRLNSAAPTGSFFAGWNANALPVGTAIVVAHHPEGDLKKVSQGHLVADSPYPGNHGSTLLNEVKYSSGTTEPGSSGAGLFSFDGTQYQLRGALFAGGAACETPNDSDWYSQFDKSYAALQPYLNPAIVPAANYSDLWWNASESGWGLNVVQHTTNALFAVWFVYAPNGTPTWYTLTNGSWTSPTSYAAQVFATTGPPASSATFDGSSVKVRQAGVATIRFSDSSHGIFSYTVDGVTGQKAIARQPY
jgi:lysyl endopeptidase